VSDPELGGGGVLPGLDSGLGGGVPPRPIPEEPWLDDPERSLLMARSGDGGSGDLLDPGAGAGAGSDVKSIVVEPTD